MFLPAVVFLAFTGCNSDDNDDNPSVVATWFRSDDNDNTLCFNSDGTFAQYENGKQNWSGTYSVITFCNN